MIFDCKASIKLCDLSPNCHDSLLCLDQEHKKVPTNAADCDVVTCSSQAPNAPFNSFIICAAEKCGTKCGPANQMGPGALTIGFNTPPSQCK